MNVSKTKAFHVGEKTARAEARKCPRFVRGKGVERNSVKCAKSDNWVHKRWYEIRESTTKAKKLHARNARIC